MTCEARHPDHGYACARLEPCKPGQAHLTQVGRYWTEWFDKTNKVQPPEEPKPKAAPSGGLFDLLG